MKMLILAVAAVLAAAPDRAVAQQVGGQFEMFDVAVRSGRIVGRYHEEQGTGPARTCSFTFSGTLRPDGRATVTARGGGAAPATGMLRLNGEELALSLPNVNNFNGCFVPKGEPLTGSRTLSAAWLDLARITAPRARFRATPGGKAGGRYVVRGDFVGVLRREGAAMLVEYAGGSGRPLKGWISVSEAQSLGG